MGQRTLSGATIGRASPDFYPKKDLQIMISYLRERTSQAIRRPDRIETLSVPRWASVPRRVGRRALLMPWAEPERGSPSDTVRTRQARTLALHRRRRVRAVGTLRV